MIIDYKLNSKTLPSERMVWLMARRAEEDGVKMSMPIMKGLGNGELKYVDGVFYKFCRTCVDYLTLDHFYGNKRYVMGVGYTCKRCVATKRRIKKYGLPFLVSDVGMVVDPPYNVTVTLQEETKKLLKRKLMTDECD